MILIVAGPGGAGKGAMVSELLRRDPRLWLSRSWTTRPPRPDEPGDWYQFVDRAAFQQRIDEGGFLEWEDFLGALYGTPTLEPPAGRDVLLEIELEGARQVKETLPDAVRVFVEPPSIATLRERLEGRGTESPDRIAARLAVAERELRARDEFEHRLVNEDLEHAVAELSRLVATLWP